MGKLVYDKALEMDFKIFGYETGNEIIIYDNFLKDVERIVGSKSININFGKPILTKNGIIKKAKRFLDNNFDLHDINYITSNISANISLVKEMGLLSDEEIIEQLKKETKIISPYQIPIKYSWKTEIKKKRFTDLILFYYIFLEKYMNQMTVPAYIHEIIHSQLLSQKGSIKNYLNRELLSIFLEQVSSIDNNDLLKNIKLLRCEELLECINTLKAPNISLDKKLEASVYIESIIKTQNLFEKYIHFGTQGKEKLLQYIQNIFDGKETVEDLLTRYNITFENSKDTKIIKKQLKL